MFLARLMLTLMLVSSLFAIGMLQVSDNGAAQGLAYVPPIESTDTPLAMAVR